MNEKYRKLASVNQVDSAIEQIASEILKTFASTPLFVSLLRGANQFTSKLMFEIVRQSPEFHPEVDYMTISTYGSAKQAGEPHIVTDLAPSTTVKDRQVIVIDDVLDKGVTADFVFQHLKNRGASDIKLAVLCDKKAQRIKPIEADYKGFSFDDNWLVGMGMDNATDAKEAHRWLEEIWEVTKT